MLLWRKNALAYYNAGDVAVNLKVVGLAAFTLNRRLFEMTAAIGTSLAQSRSYDNVWNFLECQTNKQIRGESFRKSQSELAGRSHGGYCHGHPCHPGRNTRRSVHGKRKRRAFGRP
jgi:hypothetical protein